ncbi:hypothetical protein C2869_06070 [Saccharobesus litoralis]|uniref:SPOR domain-containing protein n=2 Tax=Saccharobesus litoralis TaxID=2172099 RepID=A0A2S0VP84_9ALTE|nr:hypothetical protein C2869_06070 [Saccharobesus litoralis]
MRIMFVVLVLISFSSNSHDSFANKKIRQTELVGNITDKQEPQGNCYYVQLVSLESMSNISPSVKKLSNNSLLTKGIVIIKVGKLYVIKTTSFATKSAAEAFVQSNSELPKDSLVKKCG